MSLKTLFAAALLAATASTAMAQTAQPTQPTNQQRTTTTPAAPAQAPAAQRPATAAPAAPAAAAPAAAQPARPAANQSQLVNLNTATKDELDKLPQIGDARAQAIIAKRPYKDWNDFVAKGAIPSNAEAAIKDKVRFR